MTISCVTKIDDDLKMAMKAKEVDRVGTLRLIKAAVKNKEIDFRRALSEQEFFAVLSTMVKQRKDSAEQYEKAGRADLAKKETDEIGIIQGYLPKALSENELANLIADAIKAVDAKDPKDMGRVMAELKNKTAGRADGKILADRVKAALQN